MSSCRTRPQAELWLSPARNSPWPSSCRDLARLPAARLTTAALVEQGYGVQSSGRRRGLRKRARGKTGGAGQCMRPVPNVQNTPKGARDGNGHSTDHLTRSMGKQGCADKPSIESLLEMMGPFTKRTRGWISMGFLESLAQLVGTWC